MLGANERNAPVFPSCTSQAGRHTRNVSFFERMPEIEIRSAGDGDDGSFPISNPDISEKSSEPRLNQLIPVKPPSPLAF
jgi:hypothetical protein